MIGSATGAINQCGSAAAKGGEETRRKRRKAEGRRKRNEVDGEGGDGGRRCEEKGYNTEQGGKLGEGINK